MLTSCRRMFAPKRSSTPQSRHSRRDAAVDRQNMELPITLLADHPLQLGNFTSAHLGTFKSALTAALVVELLEAIEAVAAVAHHLASLADVAELLGKLEQSYLGADNLLFGRHGVLQVAEAGRCATPTSSAPRLGS